MNRYIFFLLAAMLLCLGGAQTASAQNISVYAGNGQFICNQCTNPVSPGSFSLVAHQFSPLYVKVTDANGNPVVNTTVNWIITGGGQYLIQPGNLASQTDSNGIAYLAINATYAGGNGPTQSTVTATPANNSGSVATFTLWQTSQIVGPVTSYQAIVDFNGNPNGTAPITGTEVDGQAGGTGASFMVGVIGQPTVSGGIGGVGVNGPLQGISIRLVNFQNSPTISCAQGAGADPGSVLTDSTGYATCTPVFSGSGSGAFGILVGGFVPTSATYADGTPVAAQPPYVGANPNDTQPSYLGYAFQYPIRLNVSPATVGSVQPAGGNNQTANAGQALASPLVAKVTSTGGNPLANQSVNWSVSPIGAAILSNTKTATDANGQVSTSVTLANTASGTVTVTAASGGKSFGFTITAVIPVTLGGIQKLSGDNQTAITGAAFTNPLVVQVTNSNGQPATNQSVQFAVSGPVTLSATSVATDGTGRAQVTATAGSTAGTATVLASIGSFSATFTLTVSPPGPQITAGSFMNGADFQVGSISPCSIATVVGPGLAPNLNGAVASYNLLGYLNYTVASDTVTVGGAQSPIYNVANMNGKQQITFQVPCTVTAGANVPVTITTAGGGSITVNVTVLPVSPGVFQSQSTVNVSGFGSLQLAVVLKRDGTLVSPSNAARQGETVYAYTTGLGPTSPSIATNALPIFGTAATVTGQVIVGVQNAGVPVTFAQLSEDLIGIYLVAFQIPSGVTGNVVFSIGVIPTGSNTPYYSAAAAIYIQ